MRAAEILKRRSEAERNVIARCIKADGDSTEALLAAMRSPELTGHVFQQCDSALMREDVALLAANPFDTVQSDELVEPAGFRRIGLVEPRSGREFVVNLDMALAIVPAVPIEFGFMLTLLARLEPDALLQLARRIGLGPRPNRGDLLIDLAQLLTSRDAVLPRLARLSSSDRKILHEALGAGELPDDLDSLDHEGDCPGVVLDAGPAGQLGLVFLIDQPARGEDPRPVVPLELQQHLAAWLEEVPPAPEVRQEKARAPRRSRAPKSAPETEPVLPRVDPDELRRMRDAGAPRPRASTMELPGLNMSSGRSTASTRSRPAPQPARATRSVAGTTVGAWVDLKEAGAVATIRMDQSLSAGIADIVDDRYILLRPDVQAESWVTRCAMRLQWESR